MRIPTESEVKGILKAAGFHPRKAKGRKAGNQFSITITDETESKAESIADDLVLTGGWWTMSSDNKMTFERKSTRQGIAIAAPGWQARIASTNCRAFGSAF